MNPAIEWVLTAGLSGDPKKRSHWHVGHSLSSRHAFPELRRLHHELRRRDRREALEAKKWRAAAE
jgi:hypothetical protein